MRWCAIGIAALVIAGCGSAATPKRLNTTPVPVGTIERLPTPLPTAKGANGQYTDVYTQMQVAVLKTQLDAEGEQFLHPKRGNVWQLIEIRITNNGDADHKYNEFDFTVEDQSGKSYDAVVALTDRPMLFGGSVPIGESRTGWIGFEIPQSTRRLALLWTDDIHLEPPAAIARYTLR